MADTLELPPEPKTVEEARRIINDIRFGQGCRDEGDEAEIRKTSPEHQAKEKRMIEHIRGTLARFAKVIASQLYSSEYRCIYELIQNADDANYQRGPKEKAEKGSEKGSRKGSEEGPVEQGRKKPPKVSPHLKFRIRRKELIVETNEKGFNVADVYAICSTGKSSKTGNLETTGEKGLGFKSVFGIADEVHVHSGLWSFCFKHSKEDGGLGMVTPIWKDDCDTAPNVGTTITLKYSKKSRGTLKTLIEKFDELPKTVVMFLRQLEKITVTFEDVEHKVREKTFARIGNLQDREVSILTTIDGREMKYIYTVVMHTMIDMPEEEARKDQKESTVTLAFPIDSGTHKPSISKRGQYISAFLPIQRLPQIPFLIQANFVVAASREAITDIPWNQKLRNAVAKAFADAVLQFWDKSDPLRYHWMRYLPSAHVEDFWEPLYEEIIDSLRYLNILESMEGGSLKRAADLRTLPLEFLHDEEPLLPDLDDDVYLSSNYDKRAVVTLRNLGLRDLLGEEMLDRIEADLKKGEDSRIRSTDLGETWHTSFIELLEWALEDGVLEARIKTMKVLPLSSGKWVAPRSAKAGNEIYFPHIEDDPASPLIPIGLGLRTLHPAACVVTERASFYTALGVGHSAPELLVQKVFDANSRTSAPNTSEYVVHFEILYWLGPDLAPVRPKSLLGVSHHESALSTQSLYFRSDQPYHTEKLLEFTNTGSVTACEELDFGFLNSMYMRSQVSKQFKHGKSWKEWLRTVAGVRDYPKLIYWRDPRSMNPVLEAIIRDNPSQLVGLLGAHWLDYKTCDISGIIRKLREAKVPCQNGEAHELRQTFLPTEKTTSKSRDFGVQPQTRFLTMGERKDVVNYEDWVFLKQFGVCCETNLTFHFEMLRALKESEVDEESSIPAPVKLYVSLGDIAQLNQKQRVQNFFKSEDLIYLPTAKCWIPFDDDCVWDGPEFLRSTSVLKNDYAEHPEVRKLFVDFLEIGDANSKHVLEEITTLQQEEPLSDGSDEVRSVDTTTMCTIYETLSKMAESEDCWDSVWESFEEENLVFANEKWIAPSMCIWNSSVKLSGYVTIEDVYPNLRRFFVEKLDVRTMDTKMMLQELLDAADLQKVSEIKEIMCAVGSMLSSEEDLTKFKSSFGELKTCEFLPILNADGSWSFQAPKRPVQEFLIIDHERYGAAFKDKVRFLDFSNDDLISLHPLFKALNLERLYLSGLVETETVVGKSKKSDSLSNDLRQRAFAISCCAISHRSHKFLNRDDQAHQMLMKSEIRVSDELWTKLIVRQGPEKFEAKTDRALLKVKQSKGKLKVYIPRDVSKRKSCYSTQMPTELMRILGIVGDRAEKKIYRLLTEPVGALDRVMEDEDIPAVSWLERFPIPSPLEDNPAVSWLERAPIPSPLEDSLSRPNSESAEPLTVHVEGQRRNLHPDRTITSPYDSDLEVSASANQSETENEDRYRYLFQYAVPDDLYRYLLQSVVAQAWKVAQQTSTETEDGFSTSSLQNALEEISPTELHRALGAGLGQIGTFEGNARIGAAGELFVYETLRAVGMPGFDLNNWQSTIRSYVRVLPKYQGLGPWPFSEIADIMYEDHTEGMELFLRENSFDKFPEWHLEPSDSGSGDRKDGIGNPLQSENEGEEENEDEKEDEEEEEGEDEEDDEEEEEDEDEDEEDSKGSIVEDPILYQIEVKTTTGPCDTPFFMSRNQYNRMKENALIPGQSIQTVYVIVRVFNLLSKNIGMKIFVDPSRLADGTLEFVSDGWKVKLRT